MFRVDKFVRRFCENCWQWLNVCLMLYHPLLFQALGSHSSVREGFGHARLIIKSKEYQNK